jgi:hypothetical protein
MGTERGSIGQDAYDPLHFRGGDTDLVRCAAALLALSAASAGMFDRQERREVDMRLAPAVSRGAFSFPLHGKFCGRLSMGRLILILVHSCLS